jgi:hypothetical protein
MFRKAPLETLDSSRRVNLRERLSRSSSGKALAITTTQPFPEALYGRNSPNQKHPDSEDPAVAY